MDWSVDWSVDLSIGGRDGRLRVGFSRFTFYFLIKQLKEHYWEEETYIMFIFASHCNVFVVTSGQPHSKGSLLLVLLIV